MQITHNYINDSIDHLAWLTRKGIPGAKKNKNRQIRNQIAKMREQQAQYIVWADLWCYFKRWIKNKLK